METVPRLEVGHTCGLWQSSKAAVLDLAMLGAHIPPTRWRQPAVLMGGGKVVFLGHRGATTYILFLRFRFVYISAQIFLPLHVSKEHMLYMRCS